VASYTGLLAFRISSNGATVGDWLGTAGTAARLSAHWAEKARAEGAEPSEQSYAIDTALEYAKQALEELQIVRAATSA
jgi:hypothetical protein